MSQNISGNGIIINLQASFTFPVGIILSAWADDSDPIDLPEVEIGDAAKGTNGDMVVWGVPQPLLMSLNVIPGSIDDTFLSLLFQANRPSRFKLPFRDTIYATAIYPTGTIVTLTEGTMTSGMPSPGVASSSRQKTQKYSFKFEDYIRV